MTIPKGYVSTDGISKASGRPNPAVVPCHSAVRDTLLELQ